MSKHTIRDKDLEVDNPLKDFKASASVEALNYIEKGNFMIIWLMSKKSRPYLYLAFIIIAIDLIIGPLLIAWELSLLKDMLKDF